MKRVLYSAIMVVFTVIFVVVLTTPSYSQLFVGVQGGVSMATLSMKTGDELSGNLSMMTRITGGVMARYNATKNIGIQAELNYVGKGTHQSRSSSGSLGSSEFHSDLMFNYIEVPILFCYTLPSVLPKIDVNFLAGPSFGFIESARSKGYSTITSGGNTTRRDFEEQLLKKDVNSPDIGLNVGAGVSFNVTSSLSLMFNGRYQLGLTNAIPDDFLTGNNANDKVNTRTIIIMAGVALKI